jgi:hypothetical protein
LNLNRNPAYSLGSLLEISVARDKIAFPLGEVTGNLWTTTLEDAN